MTIDVPATSADLQAPPRRSPGDRRARRVLRLDPDGPRTSIFGAEAAFQKSIAISATRCLLTYVALPLLAPIVNLRGVAGPILGIALSIVSAVAIVFSMRRFFGSDHKYRWHYAAVGSAILVLLVFQTGVDLATLFG